MKVETMIYAYLAICIGMILFNITSAVLSRSREKKILRASRGFQERMLEELKGGEEAQGVSEAHKAYLTRKLKRIGNLRAFDLCLEQVHETDPERVQSYLHHVSSVFAALAAEYGKKDDIEAAYFPYIIKKYRLVAGRPFDALLDLLYALLREPSIYCRENAMQAIYSVGEAACVVKALKIVDGQPSFYHTKLLTDGLLTFDGSRERLGQALWEAFEEFSVPMQLVLLNYFRFSSGDHCQRMLTLMTDESRDDEIQFACIRYFGKYRYDPAYEYLLEYADATRMPRWEYAAIASSALAAYPSDRTVEALKANLYHRNWYIRFNASQSLVDLGLTYLDLIDIVEGEDRFASEILRYRFHMRDIIEDEREEKELSMV